MALAPLSPFVAALFALGLAALLTVLTLALVNVLSKAPIIGGWIATKATAVEQTISHALGAAFAGIDAFIGGSIHTLARFMDHLWNTVIAIPHTMLKIAEALIPIAAAVAAVRQLAHLATAVVHTIAHRFVAIGRELGRFEHRLKTLERDISRGIGDDVLPRIKSLDRRLHGVIHRTIPAIRSDVATAEGEIGHLYDWVRGKASLVGVGTFAFAVSAALSLPSFNWFRCSNAAKTLGRGCSGLWGDLEGLLGLFADTILLTNICVLLPILETAVSDVADPLVIALTDIGAGLCSGGIGPAPALTVPALSLPASPADTLYLP